MANALLHTLHQFPVLAQVNTPDGPGYVPYALNEQGFVVQRRYQGVGTSYRLQWEQTPGVKTLSEDYYIVELGLVPVVHPAAVKAAGLDYAQVVHQAQQQGLYMLEHPTYGPLLMRWGTNAGGYTVIPLPDPEPKPQYVVFTPYTDWSRGQTYYQLATKLPADHPLEALLKQAKSQVQLSTSVGGGHPGRYFTDRAELEQLVVAVGEQFSLHQRRSLYTVTVETGPEEYSYSHYWAFSMPEAARGWYSRLAGPQHAGSERPWNYYPRLIWGKEEYVCGSLKPMMVDRNEECVLSLAQFTHLPTEVIAEEAWSSGPIQMRHLTEADHPIPVYVPTLTQYLHQLTSSGIDVAAHLGLSATSLRRRVLQSGRWRLQELELLAKLGYISVSELVARIERESSH